MCFDTIFCLFVAVSANMGLLILYILFATLGGFATRTTTREQTSYTTTISGEHETSVRRRMEGPH